MELAAATKDAMVATFAAAAVVGSGSPLEGVQVTDSWPSKAIQDARSVFVLDFEGDEQPATMRAGGGTRDDHFRVDVAVAVVRRTADAKAVRDEAIALAGELKRVVRAEGAPRVGGAFGVPGVRQPAVRTYRVTEYLHEKGRECDVRLTLEFIGRLVVGA